MKKKGYSSDLTPEQFEKIGYRFDCVENDRISPCIITAKTAQSVKARSRSFIGGKTKMAHKGLNVESVTKYSPINQKVIEYRLKKKHSSTNSSKKDFPSKPLLA
jgi:hypothetical protein